MADEPAGVGLAPRPLDEEERLAALRSYEVLDTDPEQAYDDLVRIASQICDTPIALVSLVDEDRQWFKARHGFDRTETSRDEAFCAHNLEDDTMMVVPDALEDPRFVHNPLVTGDGIRFYAGAPLRSPEGHGLGSLCVLDRRPRDLDEGQLEALASLGRLAAAQLELRRTANRLAHALERTKILSRMVPLCAHCRRIRNDEDYWQELEQYLGDELGALVSHGICPDCAQEHYGDLFVDRDGAAPEG